jgi:hypothetical protein
VGSDSAGLNAFFSAGKVENSLDNGHFATTIASKANPKEIS